ncbi:Phosphopantetheine attachment site [Prauserella aidingensis]|uniref:beta-ketoacyl synthase N-terminal-like domain-containing protein n=1 Tax=Prauserella aidingensis TaxID=387890 RepID=UPI0020A5861F|nr:beta-ketoacyl synthase N-terminal-like domain-containing protein [Prauserella aidingensis]MCP2251337.1 Phosphopantetheine attachment site [Prauserella aidingensis]
MTSTEFRSVVDRYLADGAGHEQTTPGAANALDIAVVGMSGRFPGSDDVTSFWESLAEGRTAVGELPGELLGENARGYRWGGVIDDRECFDPEFFGIDEREADSMNLHQRLLLEEAWHALEDTGIDPMSLSGSDTGMFVGSEPAGYLHESFTGASDALVAARLPYFLDWHGPTLVVNAACASSSVAIHLACQSLTSGECDIALAAGTNVGLSQEPLNLLADMGVLSPSGECRVFDNSANGTIFSEGVAVLVLKRRSDAEAAGDDIRGVIRATGINHDGASNGLTAPNGKAQERLIDTVYRRHGVDASRIGYVEAHGTGTTLGDPVEASALVRAFAKHPRNPAGCVMGSAKANIGHTGAAAGAIGLMKVLLSMRNNRFPGLPNFRTLNPMIKLEGSGISVDSIGRPWPETPGRPRMAAVNSMGHSGTNAHIVVEEYVARPESPTPASVPVAVPLSARDGDRLSALAARLADHLESATSEAGSGSDDGVRTLIADLLGTAPSEIRGEDTLEDHGAEPHQLAQLAVLLSRQAGREVTVDTLYEAPSVDALIAELAPVSEKARPTSTWEPPTLADVAFTLQFGRTALPERAVVIADSTHDLVGELRLLASGGAGGRTVRGRARNSGDTPPSGTLPDLAAAWCAGAAIDWPVTGGRRVSLPGYPFTRTRYGRDRMAPRRSAAEGPPGAGSARPEPLSVALAAPDVPAAADAVAEPEAVTDAGPDPVRAPESTQEPARATVPPSPRAGSPSALREDVARWLTSVVADQVGIDPAAIDRWERFDAFGVDSVVRTRVNQRLAEAFPAASRTLLFEFTTIDEVVELLSTDFPAECRSLHGADVRVTEDEPASDVVTASGGGDVVGWLSDVVADELGRSVGSVDPWSPWDGFGVDSVVRTRVNHRIGEVFPEASRTLLFEFSCVGEVAQSLAADFPDESARLTAAIPAVSGTGTSSPAQEPATVVSASDVVTASGGGDVVGWLSDVVADELGRSVGSVDPWSPWDGFGVDSVVRTRVNHRIGEVFPEASRTLLFEFSCVGEVAQSLAADFPDESARLKGGPVGNGTASAVAATPVPDWPVAPTWIAPFPTRETGFSASRVLVDPEADPDDTELVRERQAELLDVLLAGTDLDSTGGLIDLHGVRGAAGLRLAGRHPGLKVHVRAGDPEQADIARSAAKEHGLDGRVSVEHHDPATVTGFHEVALGVEGSHYVSDKAAYLTGIAAVLPEGGRLLLAEFLAVGSEVSDRRTGIVLSTREDWLDHLADAGFVLDEVVDASAEAGHFLADFDVDQHTAALADRERYRWRFHTDLAVPLERGAAAYLLLRLRKSTTTDAAGRRSGNRRRLATATPYSQAVTHR